MSRSAYHCPECGVVELQAVECNQGIEQNQKNMEEDIEEEIRNLLARFIETKKFDLSVEKKARKNVVKALTTLLQENRDNLVLINKL